MFLLPFHLLIRFHSSVWLLMVSTLGSIKQLMSSQRESVISNSQKYFYFLQKNRKIFCAISSWILAKVLDERLAGIVALFLISPYFYPLMEQHTSFFFKRSCQNFWMIFLLEYEEEWSFNTMPLLPTTI